MEIKIFEHDIPLEMYGHYSQFEYLSVDTENEGGLELDKFRLTLIQLCDPRKEIVSIVKMPDKDSVNVKHLMEKKNLIKIFHYARFDLAWIYNYMEVLVKPIICTKLLSKIVNKDFESHSLKSLVKTFFNVDLDKGDIAVSGFQGSLSNEQLKYASNDIIYLHELKNKIFDKASLGQLELADKCFDVIPYLVLADCNGLNLKSACIFDH